MAQERTAELLPLRGFYFFTFAALGSLFPYLPLLLADRGLDDVEISWVMVTIPVTGLLVPPVWGFAADALRARLTLLRITSVGCAGAVLLLWPEWGLWGSILAVGVFAFFRAPIIALADAATYDAMGGERADFSKVRLWGSLGFVIGAYTIGQLEGSRQLLLLIGVPCVAYIMSVLATVPLRAPPMARERGVVRATGSLLKDPVMILFLVATGFYYCAHASYDAYFGLYARDLGYDDAFLGTAWAIAVSVEILLMVLAPTFLHRVSGEALLTLCAATAALRWGLNAAVTDAIPLAAIQGLHGITFGLWYLSLVKVVQTRAPQRLRTSLQSVAIAALGFGMVSGYLAWGVVLHRYGGSALYLGAALCAGVALVLYALCAVVARAAVPR